MSQRILIVDDDATLRNRLRAYLEKEGYRAAAVPDGCAMRGALEADGADLVILDLVMPGEDGLTLTRYLRERSDVGILILTGKGETVDRVVGLEMGADDYLGKPFDLRELLARVRSVLRRREPASGRESAPSSAPEKLEFAGWTLDLGKRTLVSADGRDVHLTAREFDLLSAFVHHPNRALSRDQLLDFAADRSWEPMDRSVDLHVSHLRRKIEEDPANPRLIKTVRGAGYVFTPSVTDG